MKCSSPCDGGIRYRDVGCFGSMDDVSVKHYPVDDSRCSGKGMVSDSYYHIIMRMYVIYKAQVIRI